MKKNLRIVSAAAASLAVAPVAASAVSVNAAGVVDNLNSNTNPGPTDVDWGIGSIASNATVNIKPNLTLTTQNLSAGILKSQLTGNITATINGQSYTANYQPSDAQDKATVVTVKGPKLVNGKIVDNQTINVGSDLIPGKTYQVNITSLSFNLGSANANKTFTLGLPSHDETFATTPSGAVKPSQDVKTDSNGIARLYNVTLNVTAHDFADNSIVNFFDVDTGALVQSGNVSLAANAQGEANVAAVRAAIVKKYVGAQVRHDNGNGAAGNNTDQEGQHVVVTDADVTKALKNAGVTVQANGFFKAPHSFVVNASASSAINEASATLPVTVTFSNVAEPVVPSQTKTIMHNAYYYDKDAKRVGTDKLTRYNSVTVSTSTTTINGKSYYEVVENGKLSGKFINADNIDSTKRTLKHNAYVYKTSKKRANKVTLKKGTEVTTYGGTYTFKNGKQYYKIGNNTDKTYVKASNF